MTTNNVQEKWNQPQEEDEDDEEALSLSDLPQSLNQPSKEKHSLVNETQEEFNFRSWVGLFSTEQEMCVADEVFFQGQILPSRVSFSSEAGLLTNGSKSKFQHNHDHGKQFNFKSKQESFKHDSFNEFRSNSSTSQNSSTSSSSTSSNTNTTTKTTTQIVSISKTKVRNQFHTHPSPKPQLKLSCPRKSTQSRKSSKWEIFRLGVVPTPEIELQDLKVRTITNTNSGVNKNCVSRNSSSSSSNSTKSGKMSKKNENGDKGNHFLKMFVGKGGGLLSGCDCSIETVINGDKNGTYKIESTKHAVKEKGMEWKKHEKQRKKQGKKVMSRRRTFEWLKELHANHLDDDEKALL